MTDKKQPLDNDQSSSSEQASASATVIVTPEKVTAKKNQQDKATKSVTANKKSATATKKPSTNDVQPTKISKTALIALLMAAIGIAGSVASYYWLDQQRIIVTNELMTASQKNNTTNQQRVNKLLQQQQDKFSQQLNTMVAKVQADSTKKIIQLEDAVSRLEKNKPSDWLIHETEYLVRIAARTMWLERDTRAAIGLLKDADDRLAELNDSEFLPVRKLIHQDIEQLQLMPVLNTEKVVLSLMGLNSQLPNLPLLMQQASLADNKEAALELSDDINDWQDNLAKTWRNFLDTFVVIHVRDGSAKPLLSPQYQQNLKENLSLKLQQVQWAAREEKPSVYLDTLAEIQTWLTDYFDMTDASNQLFYSSIEKLKTEMISFDYPSTLSSLSAMRNILADKPIAVRAGKKMISPLKIDNSKKPEVNRVEKSATKANDTKESTLTIEQQIQQQTTIQENADEKKQDTLQDELKDEGEI